MRTWVYGIVLFLSLAGLAAPNCSSFIVTKGASADGSVMITYTCDGRFHPTLRIYPGARHEPGAVHLVKDRQGKVVARIPQPPRTWHVVGLMNEHQLAIGETTFGGREELQKGEGVLHYWQLMRLALARARTAREAIAVMTGLAEKYGYIGPGETFSIADTEEAWIMEMVGVGPGRKGAAWVARCVPDGCVCGHANKARIGAFPRDDAENCLYSANVESLAVEKGWYDPAAGKPFRFCDAYGPADLANLRGSAGRVWSMLRRCAPGLGLKADYFRGVKGAEPYPLWVKAERKLAWADVAAIMRDHYEGTPFDMTKGLAAGPFGAPDRCRPLRWEVDGKKGAWERPISTHHTGYSFISQSRGWLPDPVGGVYWYGLDNTYTTCYMPLYCCIDRVPPSYARGSMSRYSRDSAWWSFNFVAAFANVKYCWMIKDIQQVQRELEGHLAALQPAVDMTAMHLHEAKRTDLLRRYLTDYCVGQAEKVARRWRELGDHLVTKYNDGYVQDERGRPREEGYPPAWLRRVLGSDHTKSFDDK